MRHGTRLAYFHSNFIDRKIHTYPASKLDDIREKIMRIREKNTEPVSSTSGTAASDPTIMISDDEDSEGMSAVGNNKPEKASPNIKGLVNFVRSYKRDRSETIGSVKQKQASNGEIFFLFILMAHILVLNRES